MFGLETAVCSSVDSTVLSVHSAQQCHSKIPSYIDTKGRNTNSSKRNSFMPINWPFATEHIPQYWYIFSILALFQNFRNHSRTATSTASLWRSWRMSKCIALSNCIGSNAITNVSWRMQWKDNDSYWTKWAAFNCAWLGIGRLTYWAPSAVSTVCYTAIW